MSKWDLGLKVYRDQDCIILLNVFIIRRPKSYSKIFLSTSSIKKLYVITFPKLVFKGRNELIWCAYSDW